MIKGKFMRFVTFIGRRRKQEKGGHEEMETVSGSESQRAMTDGCRILRAYPVIGRDAVN